MLLAILGCCKFGTSATYNTPGVSRIYAPSCPRNELWKKDLVGSLWLYAFEGLAGKPMGSEGSPKREDTPGDGRALESPWLLLNWTGQRRFWALATADDALCLLDGVSRSDGGSDIPTMILADAVARAQSLSWQNSSIYTHGRSGSRVAQ